MNIETRTAVRFIDDPNLAYIMERCRQIHDCLHVVLNIPTNKVGEITIKWVEALNAGLTTTYLAAIVGGAHIPRKLVYNNILFAILSGLKCFLNECSIKEINNLNIFQFLIVYLPL